MKDHRERERGASRRAGADRRRGTGRPGHGHRARAARRRFDAHRAPSVDLDLPAGDRRQHPVDGDLPRAGASTMPSAAAAGASSRGWRSPPASTTRRRWRARSASRTRPTARPSARRPRRSARRTTSSRCSSSTTASSAAKSPSRRSSSTSSRTRTASGPRSATCVSGETSEIRCDYIVGADGHRSRVRSTLGHRDAGPRRSRPVRQHPVPGRPLRGPRREALRPLHARRRRAADASSSRAAPTTGSCSACRCRRAWTRRPSRRCSRWIGASRWFARRWAGRISTSRSWRRAPSRSRPRSPSAGATGRAFLVGDAAHRMTPRGGRGMNTAIADAYDLSWKLAWVCRGLADPALLDTYEAERGPIGRRNVAMSMAPAGGGSDDGLAEDLGSVVASAAIAGPIDASPGLAFPPDGRPGLAGPARLAEDRRPAPLDARPVRAWPGAPHRRVRGRRGGPPRAPSPSPRPGTPLVVRSFGRRARPRRVVRRGLRPRARRRRAGPTRRHRRVADTPTCPRIPPRRSPTRA